MSLSGIRGREGEPYRSECGEAEASAGAMFSRPSGPRTGSANYRARVFYHWKKPDAKERHGFAMGIVQVDEKTEGAVIGALKKAYPQLKGFVVVIDKLEWR